MRDRRIEHPRVARNERGAVLIIAAVFMIVAVVMLAAVVDLGNQRGAKKQTTLSTDAAALAAASTIDFADPQAAIGGTAPCSDVDSTDDDFATVQAVVDRYLEINGQAVQTECNVYVDDFSAGYVTVDAGETVDYQIASGLGQPSGQVSGSSSARVDLRVGGGLYPVGLCTAGAEATLGGDESKVFEPPVSSTIIFDAACGGSGNKRQVQFIVDQTGDSCGGKGMWCWDFNHYGFKGAPQIVESDTGKDWQKAEDVIIELANDGTHIWIPAIKERPDLPSNGTFAKYEVTHFVEVVITGYSKKNGLDFDVYQIMPYRPEGPDTASNDEPVGAHLCAVGYGDSGCERKPPPSGGGGSPDIDLSDPCVASVGGPSSVKTTKAKSDVAVDGDFDWIVTIADTTDCGTISAVAQSKKTSIDLGGGGPAAASMQLTIPDGTPLDSSEEFGATFEITFFSDQGDALEEIATAHFSTSKT